MNKTTLLAALAAVIIATGCTNVRPVGKINWLDATRVTTRGVFSPSTTTIVLSDPACPGTISGVLANAQGPGFVPAVATAGGVAGGAALLRPARSHTEVKQSGAGMAVSSAGASNSATANGNGGNANANATGGSTQNGSVHHNDHD